MSILQLTIFEHNLQNLKALCKCKMLKDMVFYSHELHKNKTNHIEICRVLSGITEMVTCNVSDGSKEFANSGHSIRHKLPV